MLLTPRIVRSHELTATDLAPIYIGTQSNFALGGPPPLINLPAEQQPAAGVIGGQPPPAPGVTLSVPPGSSPIPRTHFHAAAAGCRNTGAGAAAVGCHDDCPRDNDADTRADDRAAASGRADRTGAPARRTTDAAARPGATACAIAGRANASRCCGWWWPRLARRAN